MKTITINGVQFAVTQETSETTSYPVQRFGVARTDHVFSTMQKIGAAASGIEVSIAGNPDAVKSLFAVPFDPHSLIQRALSTLGYVVGDHQKDVEQFSQWVDNFSKFPQTIDAEKLWTDAILARLNSPEPPMTNETIDEASVAAQRVVIQRMRLFPTTAAAIDGAQMVGMDLGTDAWAELQEWRSAAKLCGLNSPKELADSMSETFGQFVDRKIVREWQEATNRETPALAKEMILQIESKSASTDARNAELQKEIRAWKKATGAESPESAINRSGADQDAWKEVTGCANAFQAQKKLADLEAKLLSYASEIDALRKTSSTMVRDPVLEMRACDAEHEKRVAAERELAKVKAGLDSKRRECQTEKERADENARTMTARGVLLDKIAEALGCDFSHESLPEHVADLWRAYENINDSLVGPNDLANEKKEIASILVSQIKYAGIESAAGTIAGRSVHLSASWTKAMQAREILLASPGESIVDAAKRVMERCANLEQQIIADDNCTDELCKILHAKEGENIIGAAKRAIIPLPKPEKVEPGQRWAFVMKATSGSEDGNAYLAGRFRNAWGNHYGALTDDIRTGFYLGT